MDYYIDNYHGHWVNESGQRIHITVLGETEAKVSMYSGVTLEPITRPWFNNYPTTEMEAYYYPEDGPELLVELWEAGKGFCFHLLFETDLVINGKNQEALVPSISRNEEDKFLDEFYSLLGALDSYVRYGY